jgi:hypothetical protein
MCVCVCVCVLILRNHREFTNPIFGSSFLCFFYRASRYNGVKKNQLDAQLIIIIFRQPVPIQPGQQTVI